MYKRSGPWYYSIMNKKRTLITVLTAVVLATGGTAAYAEAADHVFTEDPQPAATTPTVDPTPTAAPTPEVTATTPPAQDPTTPPDPDPTTPPVVDPPADPQGPPADVKEKYTDPDTGVFAPPPAVYPMQAPQQTAVPNEPQRQLPQTQTTTPAQPAPETPAPVPSAS